MAEPSSARTPAAWASVYLKGIAMGVAEVVPGVSGGTIAFVSGIYDELIRSLASFRPRSVRLLARGARVFWHAHNLSFLLVLGLGMVTGIGLFAKSLSLALELARPVVWGFFFGVIAFSIVVLGASRDRRTLIMLSPVGLLAGLGLVSLDPLSPANVGTWAYFLGGMVAVSAWLLPAVSGSFLLLVLGLYEGVLEALTTLDTAVLGALLAGVAIGLMSFANLLAWLMRSQRERVLSLLTGFMAGSLIKLWPWGDAGRILSPAAYAESTGADPLLLWVALALGTGATCIWALNRLE